MKPPAINSSPKKDEIKRLIRLKDLERKFGFKESAIGQKTGKTINFFNLGKENKWQNLLPKKFLKKVNKIFEPDLKKWGYKIND